MAIQILLWITDNWVPGAAAISDWYSVHRDHLNQWLVTRIKLENPKKKNNHDYSITNIWCHLDDRFTFPTLCGVTSHNHWTTSWLMPPLYNYKWIHISIVLFGSTPFNHNCTTIKIALCVPVPVPLWTGLVRILIRRR